MNPTRSIHALSDVSEKINSELKTVFNLRYDHRRYNLIFNPRDPLEFARIQILYPDFPGKVRRMIRCKLTGDKSVSCRRFNLPRAHPAVWYLYNRYINTEIPYNRAPIDWKFQDDFDYLANDKFKEYKVENDILSFLQQTVVQYDDCLKRMKDVGIQGARIKRRTLDAKLLEISDYQFFDFCKQRISNSKWINNLQKREREFEPSLMVYSPSSGTLVKVNPISEKIYDISTQDHMYPTNAEWKLLTIKRQSNVLQIINRLLSDSHSRLSPKSQSVLLFQYTEMYRVPLKRYKKTEVFAKGMVPSKKVSDGLRILESISRDVHKNTIIRDYFRINHPSTLESLRQYKVQPSQPLADRRLSILSGNTQKTLDDVFKEDVPKYKPLIMRKKREPPRLVDV